MAEERVGLSSGVGRHGVANNEGGERGEMECVEEEFILGVEVGLREEQSLAVLRRDAEFEEEKS